MKQKGKWLAWLSLFILLCSCHADKEEFRELTPLVLGDISVGIQSRATSADAFFLQDDKVAVTATPKVEGGKAYTTAFSYRKSSNNWASLGTPIYLDDVYQWEETTHLFQVSFGSEELVTAQNTAAGFHLADYLTGKTELDPVQGRLTAETLTHQQVLIEALLTPGDDWGEDADEITEAFVAHLETATALFHADEDVKGYGIYREDEGVYAFSAILPVEQVPASGDTLFTLSLTNGRQADCIYTIGDEEGELAAGKVLRVTASYDAKSLLSVTSVTFNLWTDAETAELGGNQTALDSFLAWAARCRAVTGYSSIKENYTLTANIDLTGIDWEPIGMNRNYAGTFDGGGYTISGLHVDVDGNAGLFGRISSRSIIKNLHIKNSSVKGTTNVGGIVGSGKASTVINCSFTDGDVIGESQVGGIVGMVNNMTITDCQFIAGNVTGGEYIGGIAGYQIQNGTLVPEIVQNCLVQYATISGETNYAGGIIAYNTISSILACVCLDTKISIDNVAGGIVGNNDNLIAACYTKNVVIDSESGPAGGIAGQNATLPGYPQGSKIISCYAVGKEYNAPEDQVGGIAGNNTKIVTTSYSSVLGTIPLVGLWSSGGTVTGSSTFPLPVGDFFNDKIDGMNASLSSVANLKYKWAAGEDGYPILVDK